VAFLKSDDKLVYDEPGDTGRDYRGNAEKRNANYKGNVAPNFGGYDVISAARMNRARI
jgi:hypothetical protein